MIIGFLVCLTEFFFGWKWKFQSPCKKYGHDITRCPGHWERVDE